MANAAEFSLVGAGLKGVQIDSLAPDNADDRRQLVEIFSSPDVTIRDTKIINIFEPPEGERIIIGGHWEKGVEIQYVLSGRIARLDLADVKTKEEKTVLDIAAGSRVILPPGVAHRLMFEEPSQLLVCNEVPFVPEKCVVYPYETPLER